MSQCNSLHNTPVQHDEVSITRKSLRTKVLISANSSKGNNNCVDNKENKRQNGPRMLSSTRICETPSIIMNKEENCYPVQNDIWEESPLKIDITQKGEADSKEYMESFSSDSCDSMEASIIHQQKHSTPQDMKFSIRAVSSTPNQEMFNISKLTRNVFTQTNFTLNVRDQDDLSGNLKSYCNETPEAERRCEQSSKMSSYLNATCELTSPLSHLCSNQPDHCEDTPVQNKQSVRKLSLRSKTMICSAIVKSKGIPKKIFSRHKSMEEKRLFSNTFSLMPQHKTPPSYTGKVFHNPFEVDLPDRLSKTIFSPDVFSNVVSPNEDSDELRWTIEDISSINPVSIDEDFSVPSDEDDPERESRVQQEIDRYFSETHVVLSPDDLPKSASIVEILKSNFHAGAAASTPRKVIGNISKELKNSCSQTTLSLPAILPVELEESLKSYFKCFEVDEFNQSQCNLRRKLFFHTEDEPPSPVRFELKSSPITKDMWKCQSSPLSITCRERHFTPSGHQQELSSPEMSPVVDEFFNRKIKNDSLMTCKKTLHNFFLGDAEGIKEKKGVLNSSVTTGSDMDSSSQPTSQDTGYQTEDSVNSHLHYSTPTRTAM